VRGPSISVQCFRVGALAVHRPGCRDRATSNAFYGRIAPASPAASSAAIRSSGTSVVPANLSSRTCPSPPRIRLTVSPWLPKPLAKTAAAYERAIGLEADPAVRRFLQRRRADDPGMQRLSVERTRKIKGRSHPWLHNAIGALPAPRLKPAATQTQIPQPHPSWVWRARGTPRIGNWYEGTQMWAAANQTRSDSVSPVEALVFFVGRITTCS